MGKQCRLPALVLLLPALLAAQTWVQRYDGTASGSDVAAAIALDPAGNVYVTGSSAGSGTGQDFLTIKYSATGTQLWTSRFGGPGADSAVAVACDPAGRVYVAGTVRTGGIGDIQTIRYNPATGETIWARRYDGPAAGNDWARAIAVDAAGNVYVAGSAYGTVPFSSSQAVVLKYDSSGVLRWQRLVPAFNGTGVAEARAVALYGSGTVYVCGRGAAAGGHDDYLTARLASSDGSLVWQTNYHDPALDSTDFATGLAVDASGNVYVTGASWSSHEYDYATVKYTTAGDTVWTARYDGTDHTDDEPATIALDAAGNVYVTGFSTSVHWEDYLTIRYNPASGSQVWAARYTGPGDNDDDARALGLDAAGNVYVTGFSTSNANGRDVVTIKYDSAAGTAVWNSRYDYAAEHDDDQGNAIAVAPVGRVYVAGSSYATATNDDYLTLALGRDVGVTAITSPASDSMMPQPVVPTARIFNYGMTPETVAVFLRIYQGTTLVYSDAATDYGVPAGNDNTVSFRTFVGGVGAYTVRCSTALAGDLNPANDTLSSAFWFEYSRLPSWTKTTIDVPLGAKLKGVSDGGALAFGRYTGAHYALYALKGNNTDEFYRYYPENGDTWHALASVGMDTIRARHVKRGAALAYDRYDTTVYALKGNNTLEFWKYDAIHDAWLRQDNVPAGTSNRKAKGGSGLAFYHSSTLGDYVYALKGNRTRELWAFSVQGDTWLAKDSVPLGPSLKGMNDGSCLVNAGGTLYALKGRYGEFYSYSPTDDTWQTRCSLPAYGRSHRRHLVTNGAALCYSGGVIYALKAGCTEFWAYYVDADTWFELDSMPRWTSGRYVKGGGALAYGDYLVWALKGNRTFECWMYDPGSAAPTLPGLEAGGAAAQPSSGVAQPQFVVAPNPLASGLATLRYNLPRAAPVVVRVFDAAGRAVLCQAFEAGRGAAAVTLDLRALRAGVYLVQLSGGGVSSTQKLVVDR